jgi:hypothetical protein
LEGVVDVAGAVVSLQGVSGNWVSGNWVLW